MNLFNAAMKLKGFPLESARQRLRELDALPAAELRHWNETQRWAIAKHHYETNPTYRELVGSQFPGDWDDLPVITKAHLQRPLPQLLSCRVSKGDLYVSSTSGSTGHPFYFAKDKFSHALSWELVRSRYALYGLGLDSLQARMYGIPLNFTGYWNERLKDRIARRVRFPVFDMSDEMLAGFLASFKQRPFRYLYGYTSAITRFAEYVLAQDVTLKSICPTLKACIVTSEVCPPGDRDTVSKALGGPPVVNEYGASELGVLAFEYPDGVMRCSEELVYLETQPDEHGVPRLLCTAVTNVAFPLIRYSIGDSVKLSSQQDRQVVQEIDGRVNDFAILPSGRTAAGLTFYYIARRVLESEANIREFVVRQTHRDCFVFDVASERSLKPREIQLLQQSLDEYLEPGLRLKINYVDAIHRGPNGKLKHFTSLVDRAADEEDVANGLAHTVSC